MDEIVAACQFRDMILVFTRRGMVYKLYYDSITERIQFVCFADMFPK